MDLETDEVPADQGRLTGVQAHPGVRPQWNHSVGLSPETQAACDETMRYRLGLDPWPNVGS